MMTMSYRLRRCSHGVCNTTPPLLSRGSERLIAGRAVGSGQHLSKIVVEKTPTRVERLAGIGKRLQTASQCLLHHRMGQTECLVHQWHAALIAAELVISTQKLGPAGIRRRHRI